MDHNRSIEFGRGRCLDRSLVKTRLPERRPAQRSFVHEATERHFLNAKPELERYLHHRGIPGRVPMRFDDRQDGLEFVVGHYLGLAVPGHGDACDGKVPGSVAVWGQSKPVDYRFSTDSADSVPRP